MGFEDNPRDDIEAYPCDCGEGDVTKNKIGVCTSCGNEDVESDCNNCGRKISFWRCNVCDFPECNF